MTKAILIAVSFVLAVPALADSKVYKTIAGTKFHFSKSVKKRAPASAQDDADALRAFADPAFITFVKNAPKLKFTEQSKVYLGDKEGMSPAVYFKHMLLNNDAGADKMERFPQAGCGTPKKGIRDCSVGILLVYEVKTGDTPSGMETFESSLIMQFKLDSKNNIIGDTVNLMMAD